MRKNCILFVSVVITICVLPGRATAQRAETQAGAVLQRLAHAEWEGGQLMKDPGTAASPSERFVVARVATPGNTGALPGASAGVARYVVEQDDSTGRQPFAAVGDRLALLASMPQNGAPTVRRVLARQLVAPQVECGVAKRVWAYLLDGPVDSALTGGVAVRAPVGNVTLGAEAAPAVRAAFRPTYRALVNDAIARLAKQYPPGVTPEFQTAADVRRSVMGESGDAGFNALHFWAVRGPGGGTVAATSFWLNDDPSDHGGETGRTMLLDASGHVIASAPHYLPISGVIDLDGDGVSEIVTYAGVIRWNGSRWEFPVVPVGGGCD